MFERVITAIIMVVAVAIVASGLPLSSISGASSGPVGLFNLPPIF
jgi:type IV secretory pathway protease TraF